VEQVLQWIIQGENDANVLEAIKEFFPDQDPTALYEAAVDKVADASQVETSVIFGWLLLSRRELYRKMVEIGDFAGALRATEQIEKIAGKLPKKKD
jgi:hypothetical protein